MWPANVSVFKTFRGNQQRVNKKYLKLVVWVMGLILLCSGSYTTTKGYRDDKNKILPKPQYRNSQLQDYAHYSTIHGVKYIYSQNSHTWERTSWLIVFLTSVVFSCLVGRTLWIKYSTIPTVIAVKNTHLPLYTFPFPTITICPANKVKRSVAVKYLSKYFPTNDESKDEVLWHVMSALSLMQYPTYWRMKYHIRKSEAYLSLFSTINITDFMISVLPKCYEVFRHCFWHGSRVNCCEVFSLQRTEEGFCYSFNSLTSEESRHCPLSEVLENEGVIEEDDIDWEGCVLRRNTATGTGTGLELYLENYNESENLGVEGQRDVTGVSVLVHTSYEYPDTGTGVQVPYGKGTKLSLVVRPEFTVSSDQIRAIDVKTRGCMFPDEKLLRIYHVYTESSCLAQCRLDYILTMCKCQLYFFSVPDDRLPTCSTLQLPCILKYSEHLRFIRPPHKNGFMPNEMIESLNCSCAPTCYDTEYDLTPTRTNVNREDVNLHSGYIDVYYGNLGVVKYQRDITFNWTDLVVSFGGVASLFLGFSIISLLELFYWVIKSAIVIYFPNALQSNVIRVKPVNSVYIE